MSAGALEDNLKKKKKFFLGGGDKIDTREGEGPLPRPLNTPIMEINHPQC